MKEHVSIICTWLLIFSFVFFIILVRKKPMVKRMFGKPFFQIRPCDSLLMKIIKGFVWFCVLGHIVCGIYALFRVWQKN